MEVKAIDWLRAQPDAGSSRKLLDQDEFLKVLLAEIENQNPLEPLQNAEFLSQLAQIQMLQTTDGLREAIEELILGERLGRASGLLGRSVKGISADGSMVEGIVERIAVDGGRIRLVVGGASMPLENVREIAASA